MKKILKYLFIVGICLFSASCEEKDTMDYEGVNGLYFDVQYGADWGNENVWAHQFYSYVGFGEIEGLQYDLPIRIKVVGKVVDYDRPFRVEIVPDSTTALKDVEFEFSEDQVIKAGEMQTDLICRLIRSDRMTSETLKIQFRLVPGEYFELPFSEIGDIPGRWTDSETTYGQNIDPSVHDVFVNNFLSCPSGWGVDGPTGPFGVFTPKKYQLCMDVSGYTQEDFNNTYKMQAGLRQLILRKVSSYLMEQYRKGREFWILDEDGTMMYVQGVTWAQGTDPNEMVDI